MSTRERIQSLRARRRLTQEQLAAALHTTRATIANWETGRANPSIDAIQALSRVFEVPPGYFLEPEERPVSPRLHTVEGSDLEFLSILPGDRLQVETGHPPRPGDLLLLEHPGTGAHPFAAQVLESGGRLFYQTTPGTLHPLDGPVRILGTCLRLERDLAPPVEGPPAP